MDINQRIIDLENKLDSLKNNEIKNLEAELLMLKKDVGFPEYKTYDVQYLNNQNPQHGFPEYKASDTQLLKTPNTQQSSNVGQVSNVKTNISKEKKTREKIDLENKLGQSIMGILASLLIFIGLGFFVVLIYDYLTDFLKVLGMYTLSFSILGLGLFMFKKRKNIFSLSLTGCGIGTIYISILMTNVYFHYINDTLMYLMIIIWLTGIIYLTNRTKQEFITSNTISIIGQIGIMVSIILGASNFKTAQDLFLIAFFMIATSLMHWIFTKGANKNILKNISILTISFSSMVLSIGAFYNISYADLNLEINPLAFGFLAVIIIIYNLFINFTYYDDNSTHFLIKWVVILISSVFVIICADILYDSVASLTSHGTRFSEMMSVIIVAFIIYIIQKTKKSHLIIDITTFIIFNICLALLIPELDNLTKYIGIAFIFVPLLAIGHVKKDKLYNIFGYIYLTCDVLFMGIRLFNEPRTWKMLECFFILIMLMGSFLYMIYRKEFYNLGYKIANYLIVLLVILKMISFLQFKYDGELAYIVITIVNILVYSSVFVCNWKSLKGFKKKDNDIEEVTHIISIVINHIMMFIGFLAIYVTDSEPWHYAIIIALSGACFIGTNNLLRKYKDTKWIGFYVGIKATIYLNTIFYSFEYLSEHSYFSSITSLALAVVAILIGFKLQTKSLRVYGLALSMLSIFKLLLIDIQYDNSIGRVISFIFAGILCFGINYVYNMASKKINK